jgi:hypothetical protein
MVMFFGYHPDAYWKAQPEEIDSDPPTSKEDKESGTTIEAAKEEIHDVCEA